jgi:RNA recognition motif-containing protein
MSPCTGRKASENPSWRFHLLQLPWSTSNEDLVELFETTGQVVLAEILYEGTRSKGSGVVQFKEVEEAEQACQKFTGYVYGGRPLGELTIFGRTSYTSDWPVHLSSLQMFNSTIGGIVSPILLHRVPAVFLLER